MGYTFHIYRRLLGVQFRSQLKYRFAFLLDILSAALIVVLEFSALALVLQRFGHIKGWTLGEVAFLYGLVEIAFGTMDLVFSGFDPPYFGRRVRQGTFDQMLLRPVNITVQVMGSDFTLRRLGKILLGGIIFSLALKLTTIHWTVAKLLYLPVIVVSMICFFGGLFVIGSTITFWTIESIEVMNLFTYGGSYVISHPMHIYQRWMRQFFTFVVPAIFLTYFPALYFLDKPDPLGFPSVAPFLSPFVGAFVMLLALAFWRFGLSHYQSTGT